MMQIIVAINQFINTLVYVPGDGKGYADECISARSFRLHLQDITDLPMRIVNGIFFWQENHCFNAWRAEIERKHQPNWYRSELGAQ